MAASRWWGFLSRPPAQLLTGFLVLQAVCFYSLSHGEKVPLARPLADFPHQLGSWRQLQEGYIDAETMAVLRADDVLSRVYGSPEVGDAGSLFVAYFKSQRAGQTPHSPKNCLPGSGWVPSASDAITIHVAGRSRPIVVNRYVVSRGNDKSVVLYWYQSRDRVVASEYWAKLYAAADAVRYDRTDTALVRVIVQIRDQGEAQATAHAVAFVQTFFGPLRQFLPA
jgi:EpsI family protein